jgi:hypothetical protein
MGLILPQSLFSNLEPSEFLFDAKLLTIRQPFLVMFILANRGDHLVVI